MGIVGDVTVIPKEGDGFALGSFILRIKLNDLKKTNHYYIAAIINSIVGKLQIFREMRIATGRANTDIPTIKNLKIPILSASVQQKISSLILN
jgi:restriction endonuclease S subunit